MKRLVVVNETSDTLSLHFNHSTRWFRKRGQSPGPVESLTIPPRTSLTTTTAGLCAGVRLHLSLAFELEKPHYYVASNFASTFPLKLDAKWKTVKLPADCPWRIYRSKLADGAHKLSVLPRRNLAGFVSEMPDSLPMSSLLLPGTHDTMAFYGWPISQCQSLSTPLAKQLQSGIRVLDIRLAVVKGSLIAYHGIYPQRTPFQDILSTIHDFFSTPESAREAIVMSIKQEDYNTTPLPLFSQSVHDEIMGGPGGREMWFLENRLPTLAEVRGKVVLLSRFGGDGKEWENGLEGLGIHPTAWPDSVKEGFSWDLKGTLVRMHDWYNIPSFLSIPEKTKRAAEILIPPPYDPARPVLNFTFFSAASFPLAFPPTVARGLGWPKIGLGVEGVNGRLGEWLLDQLSANPASKTAQAPSEKPAELEDVRIRGWAMLDFYSDPEDAVVPLLVECNFHGRKTGEEGWE